MANSVSVETRCLQPGLSSSLLDVHWYAAYTCANHERKVQDQLDQRSVEAFLPLYESVRRWADRRVHLQLPLFPSYVFVRIAAIDRLRVLQVPGVARLVGFNGQLSALPDEQIESLRRSLVDGVHAEPHPFLTVGRRIRIKNGPFAGSEGVLLRRRGRLRVVLSIDLIMRSILVDIDAVDVEPIVGRAKSRYSSPFAGTPTVNAVD